MLPMLFLPFPLVRPCLPWFCARRVTNAIFALRCSIHTASTWRPVFAGYAVYTWAKAKDHYYNSKRAHVDALKSSGEHHGH